MKFGKAPRIILNDDTASLRFVQPPHAEKRLSLAIDYLKDTQVDCLCWCFCSGCVARNWPSKVCENGFDNWAKDRGKFDSSLDLMLGLHLKGTDYVPLLIDKTKNHGIRFYASFRMNDVHHRTKPNGISSSEFWRKNQHYRLWEVTDGLNYYNAALDYTYAPVRQRMLDMIREVINMYDIDGVELDFCRNPYIFPPSKAWSRRRILTDFIKKVRSELMRIGQRRGKEIGLIIRAPIVEDRLINAGMDVRSWISRKYMDILVMSYLSNNCNIQLEPWNNLCRKNGILLYPSVEAGPATVGGLSRAQTADEIVKRLRGAAQNLLAQDAEGVYIFNYPCLLFEKKRSPAEFKKMVGLLNEIGSQRTLKSKSKQYLFWEIPPVLVESNRPRQYHQTINFAVRDPDLKTKSAKISLRFRQVGEKNPHALGSYRQSSILPPGWIRYYLNDREIAPRRLKRTRQPAGQIPSGFRLRNHELIEVRLNGTEINHGQNTLAFYIPRLPAERDPFIYIYELTVVVFHTSERKR